MHTNKKKKQNLLCKLLWNLLLNPLNLTWPCTKVSRNILGHFLWKPVEPDLPLHQSVPGLLRTAVEPCLEPVELDLGTFSGTFLSPEPGWTWPGACNSAHRSYSALKAPLFYAVGKSLNPVPPKAQISFWTFPRNRKWHLSKSTTAAWLTLPRSEYKQRKHLNDKDQDDKSTCLVGFHLCSRLVLLWFFLQSSQYDGAQTNIIASAEKFM